ncbi:hypothetical protein [Candidatus Nitrospira allomarina]|uniref:Uncharacterized protein n=1 Tax=Candidatus Nitrospira allomarina TaxID=3020900 RepID=A0AA96GBS1_9BACT|nr:hypothetical protein [Candidatus Nitrospira allomarina]WNM57095.1 hypothetical protein PP769_14070 [Candidatus Nitrospira allomarina]
MTNQRKWLVLGGLLLAWGMVTIFQMWDSTPTDPLLSSATSGVPLPPIKDLELDPAFSNPRQTAKFSLPRNIFAPLGMSQVAHQKKIDNAPTPRPPKTAPSPALPQPPPPGPSMADLAGQRAREQLNQFRFLGYLTKGGESQAFLTNGQAIYIVKQGEMLEGRVQVNKIEPETVVLSTQVLETGSHVQATIPLTPDTSG